MEKLLQQSEGLVTRTLSLKRRYLFDQVKWRSRLIGIKGARGTGKTTMLLQRLKSLDLPPTVAAYFSLDDLYFTMHPLSEVVEKFYRQGGKYLFLDEVHKYPGWSTHIKNLYDFYPDLSIVFTGS
jgi:predicted AAA+ superfamily ATPase